jgi:hypothetical protein
MNPRTSPGDWSKTVSNRASAAKAVVRRNTEAVQDKRNFDHPVAEAFRRFGS